MKDITKTIIVCVTILICLIGIINYSKESGHIEDSYSDSDDNEEYEYEDSYEEAEYVDDEYYEEEDAYEEDIPYEEVTFVQIQRNPQQYIGEEIVLEGNFSISSWDGSLQISKTLWEDGNYESIEVQNLSGVVYNQDWEEIGNVVDTDYGFAAGILQTDAWGDLVIEADVVCVYQ